MGTGNASFSFRFVLLRLCHDGSSKRETYATFLPIWWPLCVPQNRGKLHPLLSQASERAACESVCIFLFLSPSVSLFHVSEEGYMGCL